MTRFYVYFNIFCGIKFRLWNCHSGTISMTHQMTPNPTGMPRPACSFPLVKTSSPYSARTSPSKIKMKGKRKIWFNCRDTLAVDTSDSMINYLNLIFISFTVKHEQERLNFRRNFFWTQCTRNFAGSLIFTLAAHCLAIARCVLIDYRVITLDVYTGRNRATFDMTNRNSYPIQSYLKRSIVWRSRVWSVSQSGDDLKLTPKIWDM